MTEPNRDDQIYAGDRPLPPPSSKQPLPEEEPEPLPALGRRARAEEAEAPRLRSLAQSARGNQLGQARGILLFIGILSILANAGALFVLRNQALEQARMQNIPQAQVEAFLFIQYAIQGGFMLLGAVFVVLGILVKSYPLVCTVTGLVLYVAATLLGFVLGGLAAGAGLIIKIIIIVALVKAVQAAIAYERMEHETAESED